MTAPLRDATAERAVLGCCLLAGRVPDVAQGLTQADFGDARAAHIWAAMLALHAAGTHLDCLTVGERLKADGHLGEVGGIVALQALQDMVATDAGLPAFVATCRDFATRRALLAQAATLEARARDTRTPAARVAQEAAQALTEAAARGTPDDDETGAVDVLEANAEWEAFYAGGRPPYLACGVDVLDGVFRGFHHNLNLVGAKASMGKTAFVASCIGAWVEEGLPGGIFGLEDGTGWLLQRHGSRAVGIPYADWGAVRLHEHQQEAYAHFMGNWHARVAPLLLVHRGSGLQSADLVRKAERWIRKGAKWIVIDHGGRIGHRVGNDNRERMDLAIMRTVEALDNLAHNAKVPIVVNWHFNRAFGREGVPTMEAFKESGYLEAFSGSMLGLWERPENPGALLCTVVKNRKGPRDVTVALRRDAEHGLVHRAGGEVLDLRAEAQAREAERQQSSRPKARGKNLFNPSEAA